MAKPTIVTRTDKGSALTFAEGDSNFTNLRDATITVTDGSNSTAVDLNGTITFTAGANMTVTESAGAITFASTASGGGDVVDDTTPQLGGNLDVNGNSIVSASAGNIAITPDTTGSIVLDGLNWPQADGATGEYLKTDGAGQLDWQGITEATGNELENVVEDTSPQLGGHLDVNGSSIISVSNGNIILAPDGTGVTYINNGIISLGDYGASGFGVVTGTTGKGFSALTNAGATGATDPQFALTNGGGATLSAGAGVLSLNGASATFNGLNVNNLQLDDYKETIYTGGSTTGTITPDVANGNVQSISLTGDITFNAFANAEAGQSMTLIIDTNGTGRTLTSTMLFAGGSKTLSTTDTVDVMTVFYDGTTYYASLATNFS